MSSVYVHIPFCLSICFYCDFCRILYREEVKQAWLDRIAEEIQDKDLGSIDTLYFGGGTPSALCEKDFERLANCFIPYLSDNYEWTVECNPDSVTETKVKLYQSLGVNRISLGVQSFQDSMLQAIGRKHTVKDVYHSVSLFRQNGIDNISIDLIFGLPKQTMEDVQKDLDCFFSMNLDHLSIYSLQIEENSVFGKKGIESCDEDLEPDMYEYIRKECLQHGYEHYEISSYARNGKYSRHNLSYWNDSDFIGIGCGASGKEHGIRYSNTDSLKSYLENGASPVYEKETLEERSFNAIMMALRTSFGLHLDSWNQRYGKNFEKQYGSILLKWMPDCLIIEDGYLKTTDSGMEILNTILIDFMDVN